MNIKIVKPLLKWIGGKTQIIDKEYEVIDDINFIQKEEIVITISNNGYIKRTPLENYRAQNRGGKGKSGMSTRDEDFVKEIHLTNTHAKLLVFSSFGKVYSLRSFDIPESNLKSRGKAIINLLPFSQHEIIATFLPLPIQEKEWKNKAERNTKGYLILEEIANRESIHVSESDMENEYKTLAEQTKQTAEEVKQRMLSVPESFEHTKSKLRGQKVLNFIFSNCEFEYYKDETEKKTEKLGK